MRTSFEACKLFFLAPSPWHILLLRFFTPAIAFSKKRMLNNSIENPKRVMEIKITRRLVAVTCLLCLLSSAAPPVHAKINDVDIANQSGTDAGGKADGNYEDEFFCLPCNNPETGTQATWALSYGAVVTGGAIKNFTHKLTATVNHNGNGATTVKVSSKHGLNLPPRKVTRKNSIAHGTSWDNHTASVTPKNSGKGFYTSKWDHSSKKIAFNMTDFGGADDTVTVDYAPEIGILALATSGVMTVNSESELFEGAYQVDFHVAINLIDDRIDSIASSTINITSANGFELLGGKVNFISYSSAGDPYDEVFEDLGSATVSGSIADMLGLTFEIVPGSFGNISAGSIPLDAFTLGFESATDLRGDFSINADTIYFGAQFSVPEPSSFSLAIAGLAIFWWRFRA